MSLSPEELERWITRDAKLWLDSGAIFGETGIGFERINIACPRVVLEEACKRLKRAYDIIEERY